VFATVVFLFVDAIFFVAMADATVGGFPLALWSGLKIFLVAAIVGWMAWVRQAWSLGIVSLIFLVIGLEDAVGVTAPLGLWLLEESGLKGGPRGSTDQLLRRGVVMAFLLGPTLYLAWRAPRHLHRVVWALVVFLGLIFLVAVLGDVIADRMGSNLDELVEEPLMSLCAGFAVALAVQWWPQLRFRTPTRGRRR
jgi:hypothetical protein